MATTDPQKLSAVPQQVDIEAYQGDTLVLDVLIVDDDSGDPVDITGDEIKMTVKRQDGTTELALEVGSGVELTDPSGGMAKITFTTAQTTAMPTDVLMSHDIQWEKSDGTIRTVARGNITFKPQITA